VISPEGGEALAIDATGDGYRRIFHWSKEGQQIAFSAASPESKNEKERKEKYSEYRVFGRGFPAEPTVGGGCE